MPHEKRFTAVFVRESARDLRADQATNAECSHNDGPLRGAQFQRALNSILRNVSDTSGPAELDAAQQAREEAVGQRAH